MIAVTVNQVNPPLKKSKRVDKSGNERFRVYFKSGNSSMLFCKGLTKPAALFMIDGLNNILSKLGTKTEGNFIITK